MTTHLTGAAYYINNKKTFRFYDRDGNLLLETSYSSDNFSQIHQRAQATLDPEHADKARPAEIVIDRCSKRGRCVYCYDKNGHGLGSQSYKGTTDILEFIAEQETRQVSLGLDFDWIKDNGDSIKFVDDFNKDKYKASFLDKVMHYVYQ